MIHRDQVEKKLGKCNGIKLRQTERVWIYREKEYENNEYDDRGADDCGF